MICLRMCRGTPEKMKPGGKGEQLTDLCQDLRQGALSSPSEWAWVCHCVCECDKESSEKNSCSIHLHFIVFAKTAALKNEEINDGASLKVLALTMLLWFIPFEISTLTQVCVLQMPLASLSEEFPHPSNSNEPTSLVIDSFSDNKVMCVLLSNNDKRSRSPQRSLTKMHSSCTCVVLLLYS